jgi:hypothetical protein
MPQITPRLTAAPRRDSGPDGVMWPHPASGPVRRVSRRTALQQAATAAAGALVGGALGAGSTGLTPAVAAPAPPATTTDDRAPGGTDLHPRDAIASILAALDRHPFVALAENHLSQEMHDVRTALLCHPVCWLQSSSITTRTSFVASTPRPRRHLHGRRGRHLGADCGHPHPQWL